MLVSEMYARIERLHDVRRDNPHDWTNARAAELEELLALASQYRQGRCIDVQYGDSPYVRYIVSFAEPDGTERTRGTSSLDYIVGLAERFREPVCLRASRWAEVVAPKLEALGVTVLVEDE